MLRRAGEPLALETLEIEGPGREEVLVRIVASGICRTDLDCCEAGTSGAAVLGHEGAGIVEEVGRSVTRVKPGDRVVLSYESCGRCAACRRGRPSNCVQFLRLNFGFERLDGTSAYAASGVRGHFFGQSSFATCALATERNVVKVDRSCPLEILAPLGCGLQTGAATVFHALAVGPGHSLAIFGVGAVGLSAVMAARLVEADPIIAVDVRPRRLALALRLGATHAIDPRRTSVRERIARITGGGIDRVVEGTGDPQLTRSGAALLNREGRMALLTGGASRDLTGGRRVLSVIQGDAVPQEFIPRLVELWRRGEFPFHRLLRFYPLAEVNRAMADLRLGRTVKPVLYLERGPR